MHTHNVLPPPPFISFGQLGLWSEREGEPNHENAGIFTCLLIASDRTISSVREERERVDTPMQELNNGAQTSSQFENQTFLRAWERTQEINK